MYTHCETDGYFIYSATSNYTTRVTNITLQFHNESSITLAKICKKNSNVMYFNFKTFDIVFIFYTIL